MLEGPYARRKVFTLIGLYSPKGPDWGNMGRSLVRGMLNSARGISDKDNSPQAQAARRIAGFADLDGIEFVAKIDDRHRHQRRREERDPRRGDARPPGVRGPDGRRAGADAVPQQPQARRRPGSRGQPPPVGVRPSWAQ